MQEKIVSLDKLANVLGITRNTMLVYAQSYLISGYTLMDKVSKPGRSFEYKIILNDDSIPVIREYLENKEHNTRRSFVKKFDIFLGKEKQAL